MEYGQYGVWIIHVDVVLHLSATVESDTSTWYRRPRTEVLVGTGKFYGALYSHWITHLHVWNHWGRNNKWIDTSSRHTCMHTVPSDSVPDMHNAYISPYKLLRSTPVLVLYVVVQSSMFRFRSIPHTSTGVCGTYMSSRWELIRTCNDSGIRVSGNNGTRPTHALHRKLHFRGMRSFVGSQPCQLLLRHVS